MNEQYALQVSDRRLSWEGLVIEEEHDKAFSLILPGYRFTVAFTGLATIGTFRAGDWLMNQFTQMGKTECAPIALINRLADALSHRFLTYLDISRIPLEQRQLTVTIIGYNYTFTPPLGLAGEVTNIGNPEGAFRAIFNGEKRPNAESWAWMGAFGNGAALDLPKIERIRKRVREGIKPEALLGIFEKIIRSMSDDTRSGSTIGKQIDHILIHSDPTLPTQSGRSSAVVRREFTMPPSIAIYEGGQVVAFKGIQVAPVEADTPPLTIPKVHKSRPCPCGSGKKYGRCHGS